MVIDVKPATTLAEAADQMEEAIGMCADHYVNVCDTVLSNWSMLCRLVDVDALLALADEMSDHRIAEGFADRIRAALGATGGGRRVFVERLAPAVDSRCGAGASRLRGPGPRATGGRRP